MIQTTLVTQSPVIPQGVDDDYHDVEVAHMNNDPFSCSVIKDCCSLQCARVNQPQEHNVKCWLKCQNG